MVTLREREAGLAKLDAIREQIADLRDENPAIGESGSAQELVDAHFHLTNARSNVEMLPIDDAEQGELTDYEP